MSKVVEFIHGPCQQVLFSPKGTVEGVLIKVKDAIVQVSVPPDRGDELSRTARPGLPVHMLAVPDGTHKANSATHAVYTFESFADAKGHALTPTKFEPEQTSIRGTVSALHYARHGEPNGVILDGGEFIHLRPGGMAASGLALGAKVHATGDLRMTVMGTRMLEAHQVNKVTLS